MIIKRQKSNYANSGQYQSANDIDHYLLMQQQQHSDDTLRAYEQQVLQSYQRPQQHFSDIQGLTAQSNSQYVPNMQFSSFVSKYVGSPNQFYMALGNLNNEYARQKDAFAGFVKKKDVLSADDQHQSEIVQNYNNQLNDATGTANAKTMFKNVRQTAQDFFNDENLKKMYQNKGVYDQTNAYNMERASTGKILQDDVSFAQAKMLTDYKGVKQNSAVRPLYVPDYVDYNAFTNTVLQHIKPDAENWTMESDLGNSSHPGFVFSNKVTKEKEYISLQKVREAMGTALQADEKVGSRLEYQTEKELFDLDEGKAVQYIQALLNTKAMNEASSLSTEDKQLADARINQKLSLLVGSGSLDKFKENIKPMLKDEYMQNLITLGDRGAYTKLTDKEDKTFHSQVDFLRYSDDKRKEAIQNQQLLDRMEPIKDNKYAKINKVSIIGGKIVDNTERSWGGWLMDQAAFLGDAALQGLYKGVLGAATGGLYTVADATSRITNDANDAYEYVVDGKVDPSNNIVMPTDNITPFQSMANNSRDLTARTKENILKMGGTEQAMKGMQAEQLIGYHNALADSKTGFLTAWNVHPDMVKTLKGFIENEGLMGAGNIHIPETGQTVGTMEELVKYLAGKGVTMGGKENAPISSISDLRAILAKGQYGATYATDDNMETQGLVDLGGAQFTIQLPEHMRSILGGGSQFGLEKAKQEALKNGGEARVNIKVPYRDPVTGKMTIPDDDMTQTFIYKVAKTGDELYLADDNVRPYSTQYNIAKKMGTNWSDPYMYQDIKDNYFKYNVKNNDEVGRFAEYLGLVPRENNGYHYFPVDELVKNNLLFYKENGLPLSDKPKQQKQTTTSKSSYYNTYNSGLNTDE
jgi:hypothetical protein